MTGSALDRYHVILGPRRVGKTTVMYQTVRHLINHGTAPERIWWMRLDHPLLLSSSINLGDLVAGAMNLAGAGEDKRLLLMLDELVYARDWDLWLKTFYDERWPVHVVATSSATAALRNRRRESGVGRWEEHFLAPYQFVEFLDLVGSGPARTSYPTLGESLASAPSAASPAERVVMGDRLERFLLVGGFPELLSLERDLPSDDHDQRALNSQQQLRSDAVERAIYKDIPQSFGIDSPMTLERLLYVLAGQITGIVSPQAIGAGLELSRPTVNRHMAYLEHAYLIFLLTNFAASEEAVQRRGRKIYFYDGAVRNAALQRGLAPRSDSAEAGRLVENLVAAELRGLADLAGARLHHWRDGSNEVDFVLDDVDGPLAFELSLSDNHTRRGLHAIVDRYPQLRGRAYLVTPRAPSSAAGPGSDIGSLRLIDFLIAVGRQTEHALVLRLK